MRCSRCDEPAQLGPGTVVWVASERRYGVVWRALGAGRFLVRLGRKAWPGGDRVFFGSDPWDDDWFDAGSLRVVRRPERIRDAVWREALPRESRRVREMACCGSGLADLKGGETACRGTSGSRC